MLFIRIFVQSACTPQVWDHRRSDRALFALPGHINGSVNSIDWHPQLPHRLASVGRDRAVRVWHVEPSAPPDAGAGGDGSLMKIPVPLPHMPLASFSKASKASPSLTLRTYALRNTH